jgi:L-lactate dehydrogenase
VRNSAYHIIGYKGATYFAVGLALVKIVGAILRDEHSLLTVSTLLEGEYGLTDVCLSVPCLVSDAGVERIVEASLSPQEQDALSHSGSILRKALDELKSGDG